jgi:hypothetical protein
VTAQTGFSWEAPTEHGAHHIEIELDHPVNPWEHEGAGRITWGASLDRLAPLGEEAVSIIRQAWDQRSENRRDQAEHMQSTPVDRVPTTGASIRPGWAARIGLDEYWIHLTLHQPVNPRWHEEAGNGWSSGQLINDGVVARSVTVEATTDLGHRALRIVEALHSAHPFNGSDQPESGDWYR